MHGLLHITDKLDIVSDLKRKKKYRYYREVMKGLSCCGLIRVNLPVSSIKYVIFLCGCCSWPCLHHHSQVLALPSRDDAVLLPELCE